MLVGVVCSIEKRLCFLRIENVCSAVSEVDDTVMEEESAEGSQMRRMQREEVRERRRMRDRQRRQSMTLEQRERHLARRRRNYQLRRLRAETTRIDSTTAICHDQAVNSPPEEVVASQADHGFNLNPIGFEKLSSECLQSAGEFYVNCLRLFLAVLCFGPKDASFFGVGLETLPAQKAVNVTKRLRLSHLRCLARSLNRFGGGVGGIHEKEAAVLSKRDADTTCEFVLHEIFRHWCGTLYEIVFLKYVSCSVDL